VAWHCPETSLIRRECSFDVSFPSRKGQHFVCSKDLRKLLNFLTIRHSNIALQQADVVAVRHRVN
jgi:hypothetical protein